MELVDSARPPLTAHGYNMILMWAFSRKVLAHSKKYFSIACCCNIRRISGATSSKERELAAPALQHLDQLNAFLGRHRSDLFRL